MEDNRLATSLRDLISVLFKRKWSELVILFVTVIVSFAYVMFVREDLYEVTAKILVKIGHEQAALPTVLGEHPMMIVGQRYQDVNSEVGFIQSNDLLAELVDDLGLDKPGPPAPVPERLLPKIRHYVKQFVQGVKDWKNEVLIRLGFRNRLTPREEAIAMLQNGLTVTPVKDSNVIIVQLRVPSRQFAAPILNALVERYKAFRLELLFDETVATFFQSQVNEQAAALAEAERGLNEFEARCGIQALEKQKSELLGQSSKLRAAVTEAEVAQRIAAASVDRYAAETQATEVDFATLGAFDRESFPGSLMLQLADLQEQLMVLNLTPTANSELIRTNRAQYNLLVGMIASNLQTILATAQRTADAWRSMLNEVEAELTTLHKREGEWRALRRNVDVAERTYLYYEQKREEAAATAAMEQQKVGNVEIIEHAIDPFAPAGIRKLKLLAIALGFGAFAALAWASVLEFFDHRVYDGKTVEARLGAPVIAVIPITKGRGRQIWSKDRTVLAGGGRRG